MLSRLNFYVNSLTPHASKNKRHKPYFLPNVTVALSSSKILTIGKPLATGHQDDNKNTYEANILCSLTFKVFQKHTFFHIIHLQPPSPKRHSAELSQTELCMYFALHWQISSYVTCHFAIPISLFVSSCVSCLINRVQVRFIWISLNAKHLTILSFTGSELSITARSMLFQISKKVKRSRPPASCLQALLFSFVHFLYASSKLANNDLAEFFCRGFIECSANECDVKKVFVEVAYCRLIKIHPYHDYLSFNIRRLRFPTGPARLFQSKFWQSGLLLASCNQHLHPDHLLKPSGRLTIDHPVRVTWSISVAWRIILLRSSPRSKEFQCV